MIGHILLIVSTHKEMEQLSLLDCVPQQGCPASHDNLLWKCMMEVIGKVLLYNCLHVSIIR